VTTPRLIRASAASLCGPTRPRNEDMAVLGGRCVRDGAAEAEWEREGAARPFLAAVLDGLGGHQGGDQASARVAERLAATAWRWSAGCSAVDLAAGLAETLTDAHRELSELVRQDPSRGGCGTTCTALLAAADAFLLLHVGDTRCYRRRDGVWKLLTQDHALVIPDGSGKGIPRLIYAVGADLPELPPDLVEDLTEKCWPGDVYVLVTDGVLAAAGSDTALEAALEAPDARGMLDVALANGGPDNATAVRLELFE
jgi:protein phosphatase